MAKQVLGRNLEALMEGGAKEPAKIDAAQPQPAPLSAGVRSLMRGNQPTPVTMAPPEIEPKQKTSIPRWYLFGGDILLGALALIVAWASPHPLSWQRVIFCGFAVLLGGCLAIAAILPDDDK